MIEEVRALRAPASLVRISPETDVPLTPRLRRLLDTAAMRRLSGISQLGLVRLVYPGATHSRLEHSLGVLRNALLFLQQLFPDDASSPAEASPPSLTPRQAEAFVLAAFLHDLGHWPFCHLLEELEVDDVPRHEQRARELIEGEEIADLLAADWQCYPDDVLTLLTRPLEVPPEVPPAGPPATRQRAAEAWAEQLLASLLSGPIDVDKMDYLVRDSLHAGVPYGRNFDANRLIGSLCIHPGEPRVAVTAKGRTAAEMMVFARYVMFSEVYWHHSVRSATAMLQRSLFLLRHRLDLPTLNRLDESGWVARVRRMAEGTLAEPLVEGIFGPRRLLWKRVAEFNQQEQPALHASLARRPYRWLVRCSEAVAERLSRQLGVPLTAADVLIDAPPVGLAVDVDVAVVSRQGDVRPLATVSPVVDALAHHQFDNFVKRVRVFVRPEIRAFLPDGSLSPALLREAVEAVEANDPSDPGA